MDRTATLQARIREEIKQAMKAREALRLEVLRGMLTAFTNELVATGRKPQEELPDSDALAVIKRLSKQRKDSIEQFRAGKRNDLASKEEAELAILETYLPKQASREEIEAVAKKKKEELGISGTSNMGVLIGAVLKEFGGNADGAVVKDVAMNLLA